MSVDAVAAQQVAEAVGVAAMIVGANLAVGQVEVHHEAAMFEHDAGLEAVPAQVIREHASVRFTVEVLAPPRRAVVMNLEAQVHGVNHDRSVVNHMSMHIVMKHRTVAEVAHANPNVARRSIGSQRHGQTKNKNGTQ